jgi:hypothetical protein
VLFGWLHTEGLHTYYFYYVWSWMRTTCIVSVSRCHRRVCWRAAVVYVFVCIDVCEPDLSQNRTEFNDRLT